HVRMDLLQADARSEPADSMESQSDGAIRKQGVVPLPHGRVDVARPKTVGGKTKAFRHHANNVVGLAAQRNAFAQDVRRGVKLAMPQASTDQNHRRGADLVFAWQQIASQLRLDSKYGKQVGGNKLCVLLLGFSRPGKDEGIATGDGDGGKSPVLLLP